MLVRLLAHVLVLGLLAQLSGLAHFVTDTFFQHDAEVTSSCPDDHESGDCPPGCPACHACDHRQAVPTSPTFVLVPRRAIERIEADATRFESPPSPPSSSIYRPPRSLDA